MRRTLALVLLIALGATGLAWAQLAKYEGKVQGVDLGNKIVTLNGSRGWQRIWVQSATEIQSRGNRISLNQLRQGDEVTVSGIPLDDGRIVASSIKVRKGGGGGGGGGTATLSPGPGSRITTTRPTISATFNDSLTRARLWVDGKDFSSQIRVSGGTVSWTPNYNLDQGQHNVRVEAVNNFGNTYPANWTFEIWSGGGGGGGGGSVGVTNYAPGPGSVVTVLQPAISAEFTGAVNRNSIRFSLDGRDFTPQVQVSGNRVTFYPQYTLDYGQHTARVTATATNGQQVQGNWNFVIARQ